MSAADKSRGVKRSAASEDEERLRRGNDRVDADHRELLKLFDATEATLVDLYIKIARCLQSWNSPSKKHELPKLGRLCVLSLHPLTNGFQTVVDAQIVSQATDMLQEVGDFFHFKQRYRFIDPATGGDVAWSSKIYLHSMRKFSTLLRFTTENKNATPQVFPHWTEFANHVESDIAHAQRYANLETTHAERNLDSIRASTVWAFVRLAHAFIEYSEIAFELDDTEGGITSAVRRILSIQVARYVPAVPSVREILSRAFPAGTERVPKHAMKPEYWKQKASEADASSANLVTAVNISLKALDHALDQRGMNIQDAVDSP